MRHRRQAVGRTRRRNVRRPRTEETSRSEATYDSRPRFLFPTEPRLPFVHSFEGQHERQAPQPCWRSESDRDIPLRSRLRRGRTRFGNTTPRRGYNSSPQPLQTGIARQNSCNPRRSARNRNTRDSDPAPSGGHTPRRRHGHKPIQTKKITPYIPMLRGDFCYNVLSGKIKIIPSEVFANRSCRSAARRIRKWDGHNDP